MNFWRDYWKHNKHLWIIAFIVAIPGAIVYVITRSDKMIWISIAVGTIILILREIKELGKK